MIIKPKLFDERCLELAELTLMDEPALRARAPNLARYIARAIDDWIEIEQIENGDLD
jgi:hypothetical protein